VAAAEDLGHMDQEAQPRHVGDHHHVEQAIV
jgi:hypothetical protein